MTTITQTFNTSRLKQGLPDIRPGVVVRVHQKVKESSGKAQEKGDKERVQVFEGVVIARKHGRGISSTITVRKVVEGIGVEKIFPLHSPSINKIEVVKSGKVRRAKLYYLRTAKGKKAKIKQKEFGVAAPEQEETAKQEKTSESQREADSAAAKESTEAER